MTTVMTWRNSEGTKGRCDAKCHDAVSPVCNCMCGGRYHGAVLKPGGIEAAVRQYSEEVFETAKAKAEAEGLQLEAKTPAELFGMFVGL